MEICTVHIRHLLNESFLHNYREGECHRKTLPFFSLVQALEGEYSIRLNDGAEYFTGTGGFFIAPSYVQQTIVHHASEGTMSARWIFMDAVLNDLYPFDRYYRFPVVITGQAAARLSLCMDSVFAAKTLYGKYGAAYEVLETLSLLSEPREDGDPDETMYRMLQYLEDHYRENITMQSLAQHAMQSESSLYIKFRQIFGITPMRYLTEFRLSRAVNLLLGTDLSIREIGENVGYPDPFHFSKLFKKFYGQSPRAYRQNILL